MQSPARFSVNTDLSPQTSPGARSQQTNTIPDLFYSDQDVIILHDIVALAQHDLDNAPTPKPLPAAALFKAYDEVLPHYGIDPDSDHHLSAFVFRIGGEEGDAPLLNKFQSILGHLGIAVELGEDQGQDVHADVHASPAPSTTRSVRSIFNRALRFHPRLTPERPSPSRQAFARVPELQGASQEQTEESSLASPAAITTARHVLHSNMDGHSGEVTADHDMGEPDYDPQKIRSGTDALSRRQEMGPPPQLESDLNRWIRAAKAQRANIFVSPVRTAATNDPSVMDMRTPERPIESRQSQISQMMRDELARPANPSPPSLMSLIDGWRGATLQHSHEAGSPALLRAPPLTATEPAHTTPTRRQKSREAGEPINTNADMPDKYGDVPEEEKYDQPEPSSAAKKAMATTVLTQAKREESKRKEAETSLTHHEIVQMQIQQQKLIYRAARARELYLASKFFNHWADRTARRLEREGVARRHMIRFRCFRGWSQMPSSRDPVIDRMRMTAAIQKLRRVTTQQQKQLGESAAYGAQACQYAAAVRGLIVWRRRVAVSEAQTRATERLKARTALRWQMQAATHAAAQEAARLRGQQTREINSLANWQRQAEIHSTQTIAARDIGDASLGFTHLRSWWDRSETGRRATVYHRYLYTERATHALLIWNLAARSQAFKWNNDYKSVSRTFDKWEILAQHHEETEAVAQDHYQSRTRNKVMYGFTKACRDQKRAERTQGRVRLFITGTRTLKIFDATVKQRKADEKDRVKKRLMAKYKQASSARKKRQFFTALSHWQQSASEAKTCARFAADAKSSYDDRKQSRVLEDWYQQTRADDAHIDLAVQHYVISCLDRWDALAAKESQQEAQAWETWALDRQRTALKDWSILSLQRGGQAHTANVAYQKHNRDRRHRALQLWKQQSDKLKNAEGPDIDMAFTPAPASLRSYRQSWRLFSDRSRGVSNRSSVMSTTDTPTRWTGQLSLMSSTLGQNPMPAVEEADERETAKSPAKNAQGFDSPSRGRHVDNVFGGLASTTPLAPVPSHLHRAPAPGPGKGAGSLAWPRSALKQRSQYIPSNLGPTGPQGIFPRSLQERSREERGLEQTTLGGSTIFAPREALGEMIGDVARSPSSIPKVFASTPRSSKQSRVPNRDSPRPGELKVDTSQSALEA